ncbi:MAG: hypothetical protein B6D42_01060 [Anaerolineae bacterium UTCFX5]|jgi:dipeptidyl aminopeptidase/acylaminoacyl peptidase|nr:MAG: hypothetical protein B6D42_01060 [Anaerolineae bacterium UTCFX5]
MTDKTPYQTADLVRINSVEDPRISPDAKWIAFVRVSADLDKNAYLRNLWIASIDGTELYALTRTGKDTQPRWSPDGRWLAFTSGRGDKPQIHVLDMTRPGESRAATAMPNGASAPAWSPDGAMLAFVSSLNADERAYEDDPENTPKPAEDADQKKADPRTIRVLPYRTGTSYNTDRFAQVYVMPFSTEDGAPAKPRRLTNEDVSYAEPVWSPDGRWLYTARAETPGGDEPFRQSRAYRIEVETAALEQLTDATHAVDRPLPSVSGRWLAYMRHANEKMAIRYSSLAVQDTESGDIRDINLEADLLPASFVWAGDVLVFSAQTRGVSTIYAYDPHTGDLSPRITGEFRADRFDANANGVVAYAAFNAETLCELYVRQGIAERQITRFNGELVDSTEFARFQHLTWSPEPGVDLDGWLLLPISHQHGMRVPLVWDIHGGPHIMWSPHYEGEWANWQAAAAARYAVFFGNPRGSAGYGDAFQRAIEGKWGPLAYADLIAGLEVVLKRDAIDPERVVVMGGSYGGYMTAWTIAHDHRFKAAVAERGVYNLLSFTGTTDIPSFIQNEFGVELWENGPWLWENSPLAHAHHIKTPLLIIHSENDFRVAISEAEQLFAVIRRSGSPVEFVRYPREGHELSRNGEPKHRIDRLQRIVGWFDRWIEKE